MKTVKDLIEFLNTQDGSLPVQIVYDGYESDLNAFIFRNRLCFSDSTYDPDYKDPEILFRSETERRWREF